MRLFILAALSLSTASAFAAETPSFKGVWWIQRYMPALRPMDGGTIPFTPHGKDIYEERYAAIADGTLEDGAKTVCLPQGVTRVMGAPYPFEIVQTDEEIAFIHESNHVVRVADFNKPHIPIDDLIFSFMGESVAHWEGSTLVIDTIGSKDSTWLDETGLPHGEKLRTVERIRKISDGSALEDIIEIEDPEFYSEPWRVRYIYTFRHDITLKESICGELERDISGVEGVP